MTPPTSLASTFSMILQEERHQNVTRAFDVRTDVVGFSIQAQLSYGHNRVPIVCSYCGKNGPPVKDCFQLHGFPESRGDHGVNRGRGGASWSCGRSGGCGNSYGATERMKLNRRTWSWVCSF
ncbi:unnamed protein product [Arabis nemorensis]|uniref:CCHC-type domain-containing protein n=1 Tax=Arabis nemorensis TaxID=586526 RepID=A0A565CPF6_9BRAS|nr:unnamed protein product [Arabis nemorensis]